MKQSMPLCIQSKLLDEKLIDAQRYDEGRGEKDKCENELPSSFLRGRLLFLNST
jgi:hypothetical protein